MLSGDYLRVVVLRGDPQPTPVLQQPDARALLREPAPVLAPAVQYPEIPLLVSHDRTGWATGGRDVLSALWL